MRRIVARSLAFRWIVLFAAAAMMAFGFVRIPDAKVDVFPEFAPPRVEIQTIALGNSSNEVEQLITVPIENQLNGIEGLEDMRSKSVAQLSSIVLIFGRGTDELRARQLVAERLAEITATLPSWASPPFMMPALSSTSRILKIGLTLGHGQPDRPVDHRVLEDPGPAAPGARRRPGRDLGRAAAAAPRPGRPGEAGAVRRQPAAGDGRRGRRAWRPACCGTPTAPWSAPAASSRPATAGSTSGTSSRSRTRSSSRRCRSRSGTAGSCGWAIWATCSSIRAR